MTPRDPKASSELVVRAVPTVGVAVAVAVGGGAAARHVGPISTDDQGAVVGIQLEAPGGSSSFDGMPVVSVQSNSPVGTATVSSASIRLDTRGAIG